MFLALKEQLNQKTFLKIAIFFFLYGTNSLVVMRMHCAYCVCIAIAQYSNKQKMRFLTLFVQFQCSTIALYRKNTENAIFNVILTVSMHCSSDIEQYTEKEILNFILIVSMNCHSAI